MPVDDEVLDTPVNDDQGEQGDKQGDDGVSNSSSDSDGNQRQQETYFLDVDERTKYKTADDAKKAYREAGERIAQLSRYEKDLEEFGNPSPTELQGYLNELLELREISSKERAELLALKGNKGGEEGKSASSSRAIQSTDDASLTKEEREAKAWLKKEFPELGAMTKEEAVAAFKKFDERFEKLERFESNSNERYRQTLVNDGRQKVTGWLKEAGYEDDADNSLRWVVEASIADWVNADKTGGRVQRFYAGGPTTDALIKEGYDRVSKALGLVKAPTTSASSSSSTNYRQNKADALKRNGKRLPTNGDAEKSSANAGGNKPKVRKLANGESDFIGSVHDKAWAAFNKVVNPSE